MPVIKPISDLRNYNQVLEKVSVGSPVYLTKNDHGCYKFVAKKHTLACGMKATFHLINT